MGVMTIARARGFFFISIPDVPPSGVAEYFANRVDVDAVTLGERGMAELLIEPALEFFLRPMLLADALDEDGV